MINLRYLFLLASLLCLVRPANGGSVVAMSPEQVLAASDCVVRVRVESVAAREVHGPGSWIVTDYQLRIVRVLADDGVLAAHSHDGTLKLTFSGGRIGERGCTSHGVPQLVLGEEAFIMLRADHMHAVCPILGWWQGLYRIRTSGGVSRVYLAAGCCAEPTLVTRRFIDGPEHAGGFTAEEFAAELMQARPRVKAIAEYAFDRITPGFGRSSNSARINLMPEHTGSASRPMPSARAALPTPRVAEPYLSTSSSDADHVRESLPVNRYGFNYQWPNDAYTSFNVPPAMGSFRTQFINAEAEWNFVCDDVFRYRANSDDDIGTPNLRNETAFLTSSQRDDLFGDGWGSTELGVCHAIHIGSTLIETDIAFNAATSWTTDIQVSRATGGNTVYFLPVAIHELGHAFGLQHQWDADPNANFLSVMNYYSMNQLAEAARVFADDAKACRSFYGSRARSFRDAGVYMLRNDGTRTGGSPNTNNVQWATFPTSVNRGSSFQLSGFTVDNPGTQPTNITLSHWLCPIQGSFTNAIYCGSSTIVALASGASGWFNRTFTVPPNTPLGNYFVGLSLSGDDDGNNNGCWSGTPIVVTPPVPFNNEFSTPGVIDGRGGTAFGTTVGATASVAGCGSSNGPDVWFRLVAADSGLLKLDTCTSAFDTYLELFESGSSAFLGTSVACNDDGGAFSPCQGTTQSSLTFGVTSGGVYFIRIAGYNGASGDFALHATLVPSNDQCSHAFPLSDVGVVYGTTINASPSGNGVFTPCDLGTIVGTVDMQTKPDVWYTFTPACSGPLGFSARGIGAATGAMFTTAIYERCLSAIGPVQLLSCGEPDAGLDVVAGTTYYLRVRAVLDPADFALTITPHLQNDDCADLITQVIPGLVTLSEASPIAIVTPSTECASPSINDPRPVYLEAIGGTFDPGRDVWYNIISEVPGQLRVTRCNGTFSPVLALYNECLYFGPPQELPRQLAAGWSTDPDCSLSLIDYSIEAGRYYVLRVGGAPFSTPDRGQTELTISVTPRPVGACCNFDGACFATDLLSCGIQDGAYQGDASVCDPSPCVVPLGACCAADGTCLESRAEDCTGPGYVFRGTGFVCDPLPCEPAPPALGACCNGTQCQNLSEADCTNAAGSWLGTQTVCSEDPGNPLACCTGNFNGQGGVTVQDIFDFLGAYFVGDLAADVNMSGTLTVQDIFDFLTAYFAGCP